MPKLAATIAAIGAYAIMSGFLTQSGVILQPMSVDFGRSVAQTAPLFSYLLAGNLVGFLLCLVIFDVLTIKRIFLFAYAALFAGVGLVAATHAFAAAAAGIALIGFGAGIGLSAGAVIITRSYGANQRAAAFLGTDCAFSVAGFVFPAVASAAIAAGYGWRAGYFVVAAAAALLLVAALRTRLPAATAGAPGVHQRWRGATRASVAGVVLFCAGLCLYLCGQSTFLIWAPTYLENVLSIGVPQANTVIGSFWGPSIFGLITAALLVTRVPPRGVLIVASCSAVVCTFLLASTPSAHAFFTLTSVFGFTSTCMYKLMISIGSEQVASPPPQLVTFLLLAGAIGGTIAPAASGAVVGVFHVHAGPLMAFGCYAGALVCIVLALALERSRARAIPAAALSS
jgi:TsgA-like MFS transporter